MNIDKNLAHKFKLSDNQIEIYAWLKGQNLNIDDGTLIFWVKTYPSNRLKDVVNFANSRRNAGQNIQNIGGWIYKLLKDNSPVVTEQYEVNREFTKTFSKLKKWEELKIYEKYVKDTVTEDDLSLLMETESFKRALEALYQKSKLYR